ncbi:hypothetical protein JYT74_03880, partial [Crocinitomix catalasitica]|nr:hypothetical protein [Crocinitomix catalasitica]
MILGFGNSFGQNDPEAKPIDTNGRVIPPPFNTWEVEPLEIHWLDRIDDSDKYINWSTEKVQYHSSILPMIPHHTGKNIVHHAAHVPHGPLQLTFHLKNRNKIELPLNGLRIYPIFDLDLGVNLQSAGVNGLFTLGAGAALDFRTNHWYFTAKLLPYTTDAPYVADSIQKNLSMDVGTTRPISGWVFQRSEIMAVYRPHRFFSFIGGYGKNFFGDGYRSLLLSDNASAYPYLKVETSFGTIKYVNLYNVWNDNSINPANRGLDKMKFSAMHYLSWNVTKEFNISVFETVIWQYEDSLVNRGFDLNYLNPVVFYRPVEYGQGSADNVLLGLNTSVKLYGGHCIYGQMILDEFLLSELRARSRWWGNKFGFQLGYKTNSLMKKQLYMQTEFNVVRPFTYAHGSSTLSYGHLNASVAHP